MIQLKYFVVSDCPPKKTIHEYDTLREAREVKAAIDINGCGPQCEGRRDHHVCVGFALVDREWEGRRGRLDFMKPQEKKP